MLVSKLSSLAFNPAVAGKNTSFVAAGSVPPDQLAVRLQAPLTPPPDQVLKTAKADLWPATKLNKVSATRTVRFDSMIFIARDPFLVISWWVDGIFLTALRKKAIFFGGQRIQFRAAYGFQKRGLADGSG